MIVLWLWDKNLQSWSLVLLYHPVSDVCILTAAMGLKDSTSTLLHQGCVYIGKLIRARTCIL